MNASKFDETTWQGADLEALELENPMFGYLVIAVALLAGMLSASVFGQAPTQKRPRQQNQGAAFSDQTPVTDIKLSSMPSQDLTDSPKNGSHVNPSAGRRWVLGVRAKATSVGCLINEIVAGSAAADAQLAIGDRILAVDGKQCGWIGPRHVSLFRLVDEAPTQTTRILVQRRTTGRISLLQVKLKTLPQTLGAQ